MNNNLIKKLQAPFSTREKLIATENDIAHYNREVQKINSKFKVLNLEKIGLLGKISRKTIYKLKLIEDLDNENI